MKRNDDEYVPAQTKGPGARKFIKQELANKRLVNCSFCPFNRGENAKRKPKRSWKENRKNKFK